MADNKKYYYLKLKENFFDTDEMVILESMPDGYLYSNILLKLYLRSLKNEGKLMFKDTIPFNSTMLSQVTRQNVGVVEKAMDIFQKLGLVEILDNGAIYMSDIQNFIGKSSSEADRIRDYRNKIDKEKEHKKIENNANVQMYNKSTPKIEIELEKEIEIEIEIDKKKDKIPYQQIVDMYNNTCVSLSRIIKLSETRKKAIRARLKTYTIEDLQNAFNLVEQSDFLKGSNDRNWIATFDWIMKDSNLAKVLDGNYVNRNSNNLKNYSNSKYNKQKIIEYPEFD